MRAAVEKMKPYVPGTSLEQALAEFGDGELVKVNQNENPLGPSPLAIEAVSSMLSGIHTYPDGLSPALRARLADLWDLPSEWFLVGNGSDEVFRLLAETYLNPGDIVVVPAPSFAGYRLVAELMGAEVVPIPLLEDAMDVATMARVAARTRARLIFLCRPNNPTGAVFSERMMREVMPSIPPETLVVLDEAYAEFDTTPFDSRELSADFPNLVVTRTFSKLYGLAGLRLGYGVMRPEVLAPLLRIRDPFSVNLPAVAAGIAALDDVDHIERTLRLVNEGKRYFSAVFDRLGVPYVASEANFILFHTQQPAVDFYRAMLRRGVLLRPCGSFGLPHSLRVTIGTAGENEAFALALEAVMATGS